jgi:hypothetical protein
MATTIDKDLANALKVARGGKPMQFAFLPKGNEGKLLVGRKIPPKEIADTKKETGATAVFKGRCVGEEGTLVFYVLKEPPGTLLGQLKKRLKDDAGATFPIDIRVRADAEAEPVEGESVGTAEPAPNPASSQSPSAATAPGQAAAGTPPASVALKAAVMKRLNTLSLAIKEALKGPQAARVQPLFVAVGGHIKKEEYLQADKRLDELEPLLAQAASVPAAPLAPPQAPAAAPADALEAEWKRRAAALEPRVLDAEKNRRGEQTWLSRFNSAQDLASLGDFAKAMQVLDKLQGLLDGAGAAEDGPNAAAIKAALGGWDTARGAAIGELEQLGNAVEAYDHPQAAEAAIHIRAVRANLTPKPDTLQKVQELEAYLESDTIIAETEQPNGFGITVSLRQPLLAALSKLKPLMSA